MKKKTNLSDGSKYMLKWVFFIAVCLILGGTFSFGIVLVSAEAISGKEGIDPVWMVGMIPLMCLVAVPVTYIIAKQVTRALEVLLGGMEEVANGNLEVYIPTAHAKDFGKVYDNFNKMVAEIQSVQSMRNEMVDFLSHELKTPISSVSGFAKLLQEKNLSPEKRQEYLTIIIKESERLASLTNNFLLLSKIDSQQIVSHKKTFSLNAQLAECAICLENQWASKNIDLSADLIDIEFEGDPELTESLWMNLLGNAIKFTPKNGEINLRMQTEGAWVIVKISDTGIGMKKEVREHIFDKFYQAQGAQSQQGHGLGLSIVKRIVELCEGTITVESEEGVGSTFTVSLPIKTSK